VTGPEELRTISLVSQIYSCVVDKRASTIAHDILSPPRPESRVNKQKVANVLEIIPLGGKSGTGVPPVI
jgi:hypothetical protein